LQAKIIYLNRLIFVKVIQKEYGALIIARTNYCDSSTIQDSANAQLNEKKRNVLIVGFSPFFRRKFVDLLTAFQNALLQVALPQAP